MVPNRHSIKVKKPFSKLLRHHINSIRHNELFNFYFLLVYVNVYSVILSYLYISKCTIKTILRKGYEQNVTFISDLNISLL